MSTNTQLGQLPRPTFARTVRGAGPGLALAHGAGGSIDGNYGPILDELAAGHTVVGVDYPGTGATPRSERPLDLDELADQLVAAADAEGLETFAVAGYSLGGPVAIRAAIRHPERVKALILTATFAQRDTKLALAADVWHRLDAAGDRELLAKYLNLIALSTTALRSLTDEQLQAAVTGLAGAIAAGTPEQTELVGRADVRDDLARIAVPTLVIVTGRDPLVSPELQRELAAAIPGARLAVLDAGHLPIVEQPETWRDLITGFLAEYQR